MNQNKQLWLLTLLLIAMLGGGALATGFAVVRSAQARQTSGQPKEKWEYCAIVRADYGSDNFGRSNAKVRIRYFDLQGSREEIVEAQLETSNHRFFNAGREGEARALAKLGNDGWEMVGRESNGGEYYNFIYFKRLKQ